MAKPMSTEAFAIARQMPLGALVVILPPKTLSRRDLADLGTLACTEAAGLGVLAERQLERLEKRWDISGDDRLIAGALPDPAEFSPDELRRLDRADQNVGALINRLKEGKLTRDQRNDVRERRTEASQEIGDISINRQMRARGRSAEMEVSRGLYETVGLAESRGERISVVVVAGKARAGKKVGLDLAYDRGKLDGHRISAEALKDIGVVYGDCYETALGARGPDRSKPPAGDKQTAGSRAPMVPLQAREKLDTMRGVLSVEPLGGRMSIGEIAALDLVCGLAFTVSQAAARLRKDQRTVLTDLVNGLQRAGENLDRW